MKKIILSFAIVAAAAFTSCDLIGKKSDGKDGSAQQEQTGSGENDVLKPDDQQPEVSVPDNEKAKKITAKYNQGPAINNNDYADALEYAEIYLSLSAGHLAALGSDDKAEREAAEQAIGELEKKYPYNAELIQILYQASALEKTEGGLVPLNDDNRARLEALAYEYDNVGAK